MYEYKFVTIERSPWTGKLKKDYQEVIITHAKDGWRLNNIFQEIRGGHIYSIDLIFEKKVRND